MTKSKTPLLGILLSLLLLLPLADPSFAQDDRRTRKARSRDIIESLELFGKVYERIARNYVDEIDPNELIESAIDGMLEDLDPHTALLKEEVYDDLMVSTQGEFGGLGIQITVRDGYPTVISPIDGTPAFRLGIQGGDQIVRIEGESTEGWKSSDAVKKLRGPKGSSVNIGIRRVGEEKILPFTIVRDIIKIESVPHAFMLTDDIGYVRISNFARTTAMELTNAIEALESQGMQKMVVDLRWNPGGLLQAAKDVSEMFLERGDLIVYTKGRLSQQNMSYYATDNAGKKWKERPLIVLVNGSSASASEILSGAIQDHDIGAIMGQTTFGKGSVQTVFELSRSEALKLTTAAYYTPSGRSIHKDRTRDGEEIADAELEEANDVEVAETYATDMGRKVTGGGGIVPDLDIEPSLLSDFAVAVERDATYFQYANRYLAENPDTTTDVEITDAMLEEFYALASEREDLPGYFEDMELEMASELFEENADDIRSGIRREIVRRLDGQSAAYKVSLERDGQLWEAVDILKQVDSRVELLRLTSELKEAQVAASAAEEADATETAEVN